MRTPTAEGGGGGRRPRGAAVEGAYATTKVPVTRDAATMRTGAPRSPGGCPLSAGGGGRNAFIELDAAVNGNDRIPE